MDQLSVEDALKKVCIAKDTSFTVEFRDSIITMDLLTGIEASLVSAYAHSEDTVSVNEYSAETLLYAIRDLDGVKFDAHGMSDKQKERSRELLLGMPNLMLSFLYQSYLKKEMEFDATVGVAQLRNLLTVGVVAQLAGIVDFPILLSDLVTVVAEKETPVEIMEALVELQEARVETSEETEGGESEESGEEVVQEHSTVVEEPISMPVVDRAGLGIEPEIGHEEFPEDRLERMQAEPVAVSEEPKELEDLPSIADVTNPDGSMGKSAEQKTMDQIKDRKNRINKRDK